MSETAYSNERDDLPTAPPASWLAVVSLAFGAFGLVTAEFLPISLLTPIAGELGVSMGVVGQAITATAAVAAIAGPFLILVSGELDRQKIVFGLTAMLIISNVLSAYAPSITILLAARAILGFALGSFWAMVAALALRLVPADKVPRAISIIIMGISLATVFAAPLGTFLGGLWGWRAAFIAGSGIGLVALVTQILTLPKLPHRRARPELLQSGAVAPLGSHRFWDGIPRRIRPLRRFHVRPPISGRGYAPRHFNRLTCSSGFRPCRLPGQFRRGFIAERNPGWAVALSAFLIASAAFALTLLGAVAGVAFTATALWGFAFGSFPVAISIWNARAAPDHAESAGALLASIFQVAIATGSGLGGLIIDGFGSTGVTLYAASAALIGAMVILGFKRQ
ncbi:MFS transporter (plasmid) [Aliirhizobium terrae]|uniref:MFS transporter n=1 Tax=Terrirhizobium terrae TaxID=2926709 RepID=UPI0025758E7C|nr:MFS transporter [Rhizobium sp. CC-CFT758]WJH38297.1 MFS transporter [Rhizobium sp. CC-CFT758]